MRVAVEAIAGAAIAHQLVPGAPTWAAALLFMAALTAVNLYTVKSFGRFEFAPLLREGGRLCCAVRRVATDRLRIMVAMTAPMIRTRVGVLAAAIAIGAGVGLATPLGFAHLAAAHPAGTARATMGAAEVGRELGDAGGPLLVGVLAAAATLVPGFLISPRSWLWPRWRSSAYGWERLRDRLAAGAGQR
ncbi:hypothetical protein ABZ342_16870 [Amycolatopsis sp. NPDC005961]|uniref:hypothetical protein n=1 Tax=Amycolatopsis sp. NPDC005961 TaxID=3156720 RepID=UPI0033D0F294